MSRPAHDIFFDSRATLAYIRRARGLPYTLLYNKMRDASCASCSRMRDYVCAMCVQTRALGVGCLVVRACARARARVRGVRVRECAWLRVYVWV